jgi:hypothetical protein
MLFDLSPFIQNTMSDSGVESVAPYEGNTSMPSLLPGDVSNNSSPWPSGALPITSKRKTVSMGSSRSSNIPLPSTHVPRTQSELQLYLDEEVAEQRDINMFYRLVNGIRERQLSPTRDMEDSTSSERSIAGIYHTRLASHVEDCEQNWPLDPADTPKWEPLDSTRQVSKGPGSTNDEWSMSGFDSSQHERPIAIATNALHGEEDDEDDYGVFSFDL